MMKKLLFLGLLVLFTFAQAKIIDGIVCVVEGECITSAEVRAIRRQYSLPQKAALDLLIADRLQKSAMKDIVVDENLIDSKISSIAAKNNLTVPQMQKILKAQGTSWGHYRSGMRNALKKEKFFQEHIIKTIPEPSEDELKLYYTKHKRAFVIPRIVNLIEYSSKSEKKMKDFLRTKNTKMLKSRRVSKLSKNLNLALLNTILQTPNGSYTRSFNAGDQYIAYKVLSKKGTMTMPFEAAKGAVVTQWKRQQQGKAIKDYFEKLKTNADVQYIER
ncbi:Possible periplasmic protein [hydrothermal vent metagenome]|uniref:Possible periplasmic protein n=1 Tax=hydrothermal vent metagenome TaxID=652676 RepID=A0A1W1CDN8_9ZZZZ